MDLHLRGKLALITGGSRGIGAAAAEVLAEEGCNLQLAARGASGLNQLAERLRGSFRIDVTTHVVDMTQAADVQRLARTSLDADIVINNAGDIPAGSIEKIDDASWRRAWELKVFGYINLTRLVYAQMKTRGGGVIINDIGASGERADVDYIAGSTGNAALMAFTRALGGRSMDDNIRVVGINPGPVETDRILALMKGIAKSRFGNENRFTEFTNRFPLGRAAKPREIADAIAFLASDRSSYTSGAIFTIDGGLCARGF